MLIRGHEPLRNVVREEQDDIDLVIRDNALRLLARSGAAR